MYHETEKIAFLLIGPRFDMTIVLQIHKALQHEMSMSEPEPDPSPAEPAPTMANKRVANWITEQHKESEQNPHQIGGRDLC